MPTKVMLLSKNDRWHPLEELGAKMVKWSNEMDGIQIEHTHDKDILGQPQLANYDVCVLCTTMGELTPEQEDGVVRYVGNGGALFGIHSATVFNEKHSAYRDVIGGRFLHHSPYHEFPVSIEKSAHPITQGVDNFEITDELYVLDRTPPQAEVLATAVWEDQPQPMVYIHRYATGTVLYNALGHDQAAYDHPSFQKLVTQGLQWICEQV